jgi:hypothetical protein
VSVSENDPIEVALTPDLGEAGMILGLLESRGVPAWLQQVEVNGPMPGVGLARTAPRGCRRWASS